MDRAVAQPEQRSALETLRGEPIVFLASPGSSVRGTVIARGPIGSIAERPGKRIADTAIEDPIGGYHHTCGNCTPPIKRPGEGEAGG